MPLTAKTEKKKRKSGLIFLFLGKSQLNTYTCLDEMKNFIISYCQHM